MAQTGSSSLECLPSPVAWALGSPNIPVLLLELHKLYWLPDVLSLPKDPCLQFALAWGQTKPVGALG